MFKASLITKHLWVTVVKNKNYNFLKIDCNVLETFLRSQTKIGHHVFKKIRLISFVSFPLFWVGGGGERLAPIGNSLNFKIEF